MKETTTEIQKALAEVLPADLKKVGDDWEVVWGPVVWKNDPDASDTSYGNAWFVAKNENVVFEDGSKHCTYVVAIAGTSGIYDWIYEDLAIRQVVNMDAWAGPGAAAINKAPVPIPNNASAPSNEPLVTNGFAQAVYQLLNNSPPKGSPGYQSNLPEFLQSIHPDPSLPSLPKLVFTGHSLGGALSPTLAYALLKSNCLGTFSSDMNNVYVYPTAGPSPGNAMFAQKFTKHFPHRTSSPDSSYKHWNVNIVNKLDIVPCGYCMDPEYNPEVLASILPMYGNTKYQVIGVWIAVEALKWAARKLYIPIAFNLFDSPIPKPPTPPKNTWDFIQDAHKYHVNAYTKEILGIDKPSKKPYLEREMDDWLSHPLLGHIATKQQEVEANGGNVPEGIVEYDETAET
ncbi:lipase (class 3), partial [Rhizoctonia solani AG-3 Rhs1AP]